MRVHRGDHTRSYVKLPNDIAQDRHLTYTARGLLADLLSRPDGWREDYRMMADSSPQGRTAVLRALRELREAGYYRIERIRQGDGTFVTVTHVQDTPYNPTADEGQPPAAANPGSGSRDGDTPAVNPVKDGGKEPSLPVDVSGTLSTDTRQGGQAAETPAATPPSRTVEESDPQTQEAIAALYRVIRAEPRLHLGAVEALALAPMVATWLARASERDLAAALLPALPPRIHHPLALLRDRLTRKMPPVRTHASAGSASGVRFGDCPSCRDPLGPSGMCRPCTGLGERRETAPSLGRHTNARGRARVRAAAYGLAGPALALA